MEELQDLFEKCKKELYKIGINVEKYAKIDVKIGRNNKRYGCCRSENPDISTKYYITKKRRRYVKYHRYYNYHIEISPWVLELDEEIVKNTIMHELIHCLPGCDNHGTEFKKYAKYINENLGYNISRVGDKSKDYQKSNIEFSNEIRYNYKVICEKCGQTFYRKRMNTGFSRKYRCGECGGKFQVIKGHF